MNDRLKEVVSRKAIEREIGIAKKKLLKLKRSHLSSPSRREAIFRQLLQLEFCQKILNDFHIMP